MTRGEVEVEIESRLGVSRGTANTIGSWILLVLGIGAAVIYLLRGESLKSLLFGTSTND